MKRWALIAGLVVAALAAAQSTSAVQFIQRAVLDLTRGGTVGGDLVVNGDAGVTGKVSTGDLTVTSTIKAGILDAGTLNVTGDSALVNVTAGTVKAAVLDGGTVQAGALGVTGQATMAGITATLIRADTVDAGAFVTTGRYCTDVACTTAYITNDTFSTMNIIGSVGGSGNWSTAGSFNSDVYVKIGATSIGTCNAGAEGVTRRDSAGGGTTGHRTKLCLCTSDGAGTPAYAWTNLASGTVGTTTACND